MSGQKKQESPEILMTLLRYLADSNRRRRFCRPLPSHSAKVPLWVASAKVALIFGLTNLYRPFFAVFYHITLFRLFFNPTITLFSTTQRTRSFRAHTTLSPTFFCAGEITHKISYYPIQTYCKYQTNKKMLKHIIHALRQILPHKRQQFLQPPKTDPSIR